jgi:hypothetical protein
MNVVPQRPLSAAQITVPKSRPASLKPAVAMISPAARVISAAQIVVPEIVQRTADLPSSEGREGSSRPIGLAPDASGEEVDAYFAGLRALMQACGADANKSDLLIVVLQAMIGDGICAEGRLIGMASQLGFHPGHAGATLKTSAGTDPARHLWRRSADRRYALHS